MKSAARHDDPGWRGRPAARPAGEQAGNEAALARLATALGRLHFGTITLTVHQSHIVQIEVAEKHRFDVPSVAK